MVDSWNAAQLNEAVGNGSIGGGGSSVVANPEGSATGHLSKVGIGDTIYSVGTGQTVLYNPETPTAISTETEVELDAVITGYDFIYIYVGNNPGIDIIVTDTATLESTAGASHSSASSQEWEITCNSTDHKTLTLSCGGSGRTLNKVVGIKF